MAALACAAAFACGDDDDGEGVLIDAGMDAGNDADVGDEDAGDDGDAGMDDASARLLEIIATDFDFNPEQIRAQPGETLIISLRNEGSVPHNIRFELDGEMPALDSNVAPQETAQMTVEVPSEPGEFVFYCPIANHRELGMEGMLIVEEPQRVRLAPAASGLVSPIGMAVPPAGDGARFIIDQIGLIRVLDEGGELQEEPFLDIRDRVVELNPEGDERGLLGLAFHPEYAENGRFFVYYSAPLRPEAEDDFDHTSRISEFQVSAEDAAAADPESERVLLAVDQPQANHNGGTLAFGPEDGLLYISLGDGGGAGDMDMGHTPDLGNGQDTSKLLGSILRIDVDGAEPYAIPEDNPFADGEDGAPEIFAYGFRNPYRFSFDMGGDHSLLAGDAGQVLWEEVSRVSLGGNYGWRILEGTHCFNVDDFDDPPPTCADTGPLGQPLLWPVIELPNAAQEGGLGTTIIGGYVYRGDELPESLQGRYVFGMLSASLDAPRGLLFAASDADEEGSDLLVVERLAPEAGGLALDRYLKGFGQDRQGELYLLVSEQVGPSGQTGEVLRLEPAE